MSASIYFVQGATSRHRLPRRGRTYAPARLISRRRVAGQHSDGRGRPRRAASAADLPAGVLPRRFIPSVASVRCHRRHVAAGALHGRVQREVLRRVRLRPHRAALHRGGSPGSDARVRSREGAPALPWRGEGDGARRAGARCTAPQQKGARREWQGGSGRECGGPDAAATTCRRCTAPQQEEEGATAAVTSPRRGGRGRGVPDDAAAVAQEGGGAHPEPAVLPAGPVARGHDPVVPVPGAPPAWRPPLRAAPEGAVPVVDVGAGLRRGSRRRGRLGSGAQAVRGMRAQPVPAVRAVAPPRVDADPLLPGDHPAADQDVIALREDDSFDARRAPTWPTLALLLRDRCQVAYNHGLC